METLPYESLSCRYCGRTLTKEEEGEWHQAWETGACPSCGRVYDLDLEARVEQLAQDPEVIRRARKQRFTLTSRGLLLVAAVFVSHRLGAPPVALTSMIVFGAMLTVHGAFHSARKQARAELAQQQPKRDLREG